MNSIVPEGQIIKMSKSKRISGLKWAWVILPILVLALSNCEHEPLFQKIDIDTTGGTGEPEDTSICFERDILPIIQTNCAKPNQPGDGCHDAVKHAEDLVLTTYDGIMNAGVKPNEPYSSKFFNELNTGKMSGVQYGNLSDAQKALIKRWILEGAKNGTNCPSKCDTATYTFTKAIEPMIGKYCAGCHSGSTVSGNTDLGSYATIKASAQSGKLMASLKRTTNWMPAGGKKLSDCQMTQIQKWIDGGCQP